MTEDLKKQFAAARRAVIAREFAHLNDMQRQAVLTTEGPLLLLAGAGSGKTTVLINRVANLIRFGRGSDSDEVPAHVTEEDAAFLMRYAQRPDEPGRDRALALCALDPVEPWRIMAITFTNKAADELKARLEKMLGPSALDIWAMTFHAACVRILRADIDRLGFSSRFTIYDTTDSQSLLKRIIKDLNLDDKVFAPRAVLTQISRAKTAMISPEDFALEAEKGYDIRKKSLAAIYREYDRRMKEADALDFDDLLLLCVRLFEENPDVLDHYQRKFRYILIDEYQDTNYLQYRFASLLAGRHENICVVGDDDQSIYRFRGATIENILNFESEYKNARVIRLEQNYRSTGRILSAANDVIQNNVGRKGKTLWTENEEGEPPTLYMARDERDEASFVAGQIIAGVSQGARWSDHAVLYRMNAQSAQFEFAFKHAGVPYRVVGGLRFFDRAEIKDVLAYLCVVSNPADNLRLSRIINTPARGIGQATLDLVAALAEQRGMPVFEILRRSPEIEALRRAAPRLRAFVELIEGLREDSRRLPLDQLYDAVLQRTGYLEYLKALKDKDEKDGLSRGDRGREEDSRLNNVQELKTNIIAFMAQNPEGTLADFLADIALYTDLDDYDESDDRVVLMTMHSAKGLEFPTVFIVGAEEGLFPNTRAIGEPEEMEEERRLCYVALTRARKKLYITAAHQRTIFGQSRGAKVSRFVEEISPDNLIREGETRAPFVPFIEDDYFRNPRRTRYDFEAEATRPMRNGPEREKPRPAFAGPSPAAKAARPAPAGRRTPTPSRTSAPSASPAKKETFRVGDVVEHRAFGRGEVVGLKDAKGDVILEILFEKAGKKLLMGSTAAQFMWKA